MAKSSRWPTIALTALEPLNRGAYAPAPQKRNSKAVRGLLDDNARSRRLQECRARDSWHQAQRPIRPTPILARERTTPTADVVTSQGDHSPPFNRHASIRTYGGLTCRNVARTIRGRTWQRWVPDRLSLIPLSETLGTLPSRLKIPMGQHRANHWTHANQYAGRCTEGADVRPAIQGSAHW